MGLENRLAVLTVGGALTGYDDSFAGIGAVVAEGGGAVVHHIPVSSDRAAMAHIARYGHYYRDGYRVELRGGLAPHGGLIRPGEEIHIRGIVSQTAERVNKLSEAAVEAGVGLTGIGVLVSQGLVGLWPWTESLRGELGKTGEMISVFSPQDVLRIGAFRKGLAVPSYQNREIYVPPDHNWGAYLRGVLGRYVFGRELRSIVNGNGLAIVLADKNLRSFSWQIAELASEKLVVEVPTMSELERVVAQMKAGVMRFTHFVLDTGSMIRNESGISVVPKLASVLYRVLTYQAV